MDLYFIQNLLLYSNRKLRYPLEWTHRNGLGTRGFSPRGLTSASIADVLGRLQSREGLWNRLHLHHRTTTTRIYFGPLQVWLKSSPYSGKGKPS